MYGCVDHYVYGGTNLEEKIIRHFKFIGFYMPVGNLESM